MQGLCCHPAAQASPAGQFPRAVHHSAPHTLVRGVGYGTNHHLEYFPHAGGQMNGPGLVATERNDTVMLHCELAPGAHTAVSHPVVHTHVACAPAACAPVVCAPGQQIPACRTTVGCIPEARSPEACGPVAHDPHDRSPAGHSPVAHIPVACDLVVDDRGAAATRGACPKADDQGKGAHLGFSQAAAVEAAGSASSGFCLGALYSESRPEVQSARSEGRLSEASASPK